MPDSYTIGQLFTAGGLGAVIIGAIWAGLKTISGEGWQWKKQRHAEQREDQLSVEAVLREQIMRLEAQNTTLDEKVAAFEPRLQALQKRAYAAEEEGHQTRIEADSLRAELDRMKLELALKDNALAEKDAIIQSLTQRVKE